MSPFSLESFSISNCFFLFNDIFLGPPVYFFFFIIYRINNKKKLGIEVPLLWSETAAAGPPSVCGATENKKKQITFLRPSKAAIYDDTSFRLVITILLFL